MYFKIINYYVKFGLEHAALIDAKWLHFLDNPLGYSLKIQPKNTI